MDIILYIKGVNIVATVVNNVVIGILGGALLLVYLLKSRRDQEFARAKERMNLVAELNRELRNALIIIGSSAAIDNRDERMRRIDDAMNRIDSVLTDSLPRAAGGNTGRSPIAA